MHLGRLNAGVCHKGLNVYLGFLSGLFCILEHTSTSNGSLFYLDSFGLLEVKLYLIVDLCCIH